DIKRIDLLKIDVEKSERDVLSGIGDDDWEKIRQIVIEIHDIDGRLGEISAMLEHRGYSLVTEQDALLKGTAIYDVYAMRSADKSEATKNDGPASLSGAAPKTKSRELQVSHWQNVFEGTYRSNVSSDPTFNIAGWISSYNNKPILQEEMREWVDHTV